MHILKNRRNIREEEVKAMQPQIPRQGVMQAGRQMMGPGFGGRGPMMGMNRAPRSPMMGMNRARQVSIDGRSAANE